MTHRPPIAKKATRTVFLKSLSLTLILCLLIQEFSYAAPQLQKMDLGWRMEDRGEKQKNLNWAKKFLPDIPESIATIEDAWHSSSTSTLHTPGGAGGEASAARNEELHEHSGVPQVTGPGHTVLLIQDAHTNSSCQLNESKLFDILFTKRIEDRGLRIEETSLHPPSSILNPVVFTEAAKGNVNLTFLRDKASLFKRKQIANEYLQKGLLHGIEYLDLTSDHTFKIEGVEDPTLYFKSLEVVGRNRNDNESRQGVVGVVF